MLTLLRQTLWESWQRLGEQVVVKMPNVLGMLIILAAGYVTARLLAWAIHSTSARAESALRRWGVASLVDQFSQRSIARLLDRTVFWAIIGFSILLAIHVLDTELGTRLVTRAFLYLPNLIVAGLIVVAGLLLARFLARGALIWAVNEGIGSARWIAAGVRVGVGLFTVVAAAEHLGVARVAVLAAFIILLSGTVLAAALAVGLGGRKRVEQWLDRRAALTRQAGENQRLDHL